MARKRIEVAAGSGNVFADLGYPDAEERSLKVELAMEVNRLLRCRGLAQDRAAKLLAIRQPHVEFSAWLRAAHPELDPGARRRSS